MAEYRPVEGEDNNTYRTMTGYAFAPDRGPFDPDEEPDEHQRRMWSFGSRRGMFEDDELLACCCHHEFIARIRNAWLPLAGLSAVATPPENRRQGLVDAMLRASLEEYRDQEWPISALQPFKETFYARYGWATGSRYHTATIDIDALSPVGFSPTGSFFRVEAAEHERLEPAYTAWLDGVTLATKRSPDWWRYRALQGIDSPHYIAAWEENGTVKGYLVYDIDAQDDGRIMRVSELAYADTQALEHLLCYCYYHDSQVSTIKLTGFELDRLVDLVPDRRGLEVQIHASKMVRIVDVPLCLSAIGYENTISESVVMAVSDAHAPWNDDRFIVSFDGGDASVRRTDASPDIALNIGALSQLFVGYRSIHDLAETGDVDVNDPAAIEVLDAAYPTMPTYLPESF